MKLKRVIMSACAVAIAICAIDPGLMRLVAPAFVARALADPLSLLDQRSPGARGNAATIDTKARPHIGGVGGSVPSGARSAARSVPVVGAPVIGGDGIGPFALADELGIPGFSARGDAGLDLGPDLGAVSGPGGLVPGIPGIPGAPVGGGGSIGAGDGGTGGGGDQAGKPPGGGTPPDGTSPCCDTGGGGGGGGIPAIPVPEPQTWLMLIAGFAMTGAAMRRTVSRNRRNERRSAARSHL